MSLYYIHALIIQLESIRAKNSGRLLQICARKGASFLFLIVLSEYPLQYLGVVFPIANAYTRLCSLGFASGNLNEDAWAVRHFLSRGTLGLAVAQSFSKSMGLYGERVGAFYLYVSSVEAATKAQGQLARLQRGQISTPPTRGAKIAAIILATPSLYQEWLLDLQEMTSRIKGMRKLLRDQLVSLGTLGNWNHIQSQVGHTFLFFCKNRSLLLKARLIPLLDRYVFVHWSDSRTSGHYPDG